ncbi:MAG: PDZ domain-containing protein [Gemmataceae bacterium]
MSGPSGNVMIKLNFLAISFVLCSTSLVQSQGGLDDANEAAIKAAVARVAPSVVVIETTGGTDRIGSARGNGPQVRKGIGPTTGLVVAPDGYIISSSFNFANKPTAITVSVPGRADRFIAKVVAHDHSRMVTLLKIEATDLPVAEAMPSGDFRVGQWAIAVGRALDPNTEHEPAVSVGVVSALGRIWGKMIQTDAKVSPVNYGGPLVGIDGRVLGVLVPASPGSEGEAAGFEWYDSGIGFAAPLDQIQTVLPKLRAGKELRRGLLGITPKGTDVYSVAPTIATVTPESTAAKAGIKPGDVLVTVDGRPVVNFSQVQHILGPKYEGDKVSVRVRRDSKEIDFNDLVLMGQVASYLHPFIGFLPLRDDPELGVGIRYVFPDSPAAKAGLKEGDRIMKIAPASLPRLVPFSGRDHLREMLDTLPAGTDIKLEIKRKEGKTETLMIKLDRLPELIPDNVTLDSTLKLALTPRKQVPIDRPPGAPKEKPKEAPKDKEKEETKPEEKKEEARKPETGLIHRPSPSGNREYWLYVPSNYDPNISHGLVIWLHEVGMGGKDARSVVDIWQRTCEERHLILLGPKSNNETGWLPSEAEFVQEAANAVIKEYTIDRQRVVTHGLRNGGQMAYYLAFNTRDLVRAAAVSGAVLSNQPKDNVAGQRLCFFVVAGDKDPALKEIAEAKSILNEKRFPVIFREVAEMGREYLDRKTFEEMVRWIDSLDRL